MYALSHSSPTLENVVTNQDNNPGSSFLKGAFRFALPTVAAVYILTQSSCGGQPPPSTDRSTRAEFKTEEGETIVIGEENAYSIVLTFVEPKDDLERAILEGEGVDIYGQFIRKDNNVNITKAVLGLAQNYKSISDLINLFEEGRRSGELYFYIPQEDIQTFLQSKPYNQTEVEAESGYFQQTATRKLISIDNPDMDLQTYRNLKNKYSGYSVKEEKIAAGSMFSFHVDIFEEPEDIYLANITTKKVIRLTDDRFDNQEPALSPDGSKVVFLSDRSGNYDLWIMDIATRRIAKLTNTYIAESRPAWSKDGKKIIFRDFGVYSINLYHDNFSLKLVDAAGGVLSQAFSPDDTQIVYYGGIGELWIVNSDGSNPSKLKGFDLFKEPDWRRGFLNLDWSINDEIVAIMVESSESADKRYNGVVVMDSDGSNVMKLTWDYVGTWDTGAQGFNNPKWSQDGKFIFYRHSRFTSHEMFVIDPKSRDTINLRTFEWTTIDKPLIEVSLEELLK